MGKWYSAYHIAKDHIHTDITCNTEEPQQKYRLGTVSNKTVSNGMSQMFQYKMSPHTDTQYILNAHDKQKTVKFYRLVSFILVWKSVNCTAYLARIVAILHTETFVTFHFDPFLISRLNTDSDSSTRELIRFLWYDVIHWITATSCDNILKTMFPRMLNGTYP